MSARRTRLLSLLTEHSYAKRKVTLASGRESDFFVDCKQTVLLAEGHALVGEVMLDALSALKTAPQAIAGVELGGCPLASAVSLVSFQRGAPLDAIYVRKQAKDHGSARLMEGDTRMAEGTNVAVLEDVVTTGGSTLQAVEKLRERGFAIAGVVALVDRQEGGADILRAAGLDFVAVFGRDEFPS